MEFPELSLAPTEAHHGHVNRSSFDQYSDSNVSRKRKLFHDHGLIHHHQTNSLQASVDLQLKDPLPLDWEQCLDLQSGKMYYLNRKTLRKSWNWPVPMDQAASALDLELNISTTLSDGNTKRPQNNINNNNNNNMVALACLNCHLLVILSKSSPACPNCKYVHSLPTAASPPKVAAINKPLNTLSLLN